MARYQPHFTDHTPTLRARQVIDRLIGLVRRTKERTGTSVHKQDVSYLELGIATGDNFRLVECVDKTSVDVSDIGRPTFLGTTDDFFRQNTRQFDVVFIDADHSAQAVLCDLINASRLGAKYVVAHDCNPWCEDFERPSACGDGWKAWSQLIIQRGLSAITGDLDHGVGVWIDPTEQDAGFQLVPSTYDTLANDRERLLNLHREAEFCGFLGIQKKAHEERRTIKEKDGRVVDKGKKGEP